MLREDILMPRDKDPTDPAHYNNLAIQPRDYITKNKLGYNEGNIIKYISRWQSKGGLTDLKNIVQSFVCSVLLVIIHPGKVLPGRTNEPWPEICLLLNQLFQDILKS